MHTPSEQCVLNLEDLGEGTVILPSFKFVHDDSARLTAHLQVLSYGWEIYYGIDASLV